jgi:hypothetical protein
MSRTFVRSLLIVGLLFLWAQSALAQSAGSVVGVVGQSTVEGGGRRDILKLGDPVNVGDTISVPPGNKLKLRMNDGSILSVAPGTSIRIDSYAVGADGQRIGAAISMGQGLLRSVTAPVNRPASFEVRTAVGTAAVRSTDWFIQSLPGSSQVAVVNGVVALTSNSTGRSVSINPGFGTSVAAGQDPQPPRPWTQQEFFDFISRSDVPAQGGFAPPPAGYPPAYPPPAGYPPDYGGYPSPGYGAPGLPVPGFGFGFGFGGGGHRDGGRDREHHDGGREGGRDQRYHPQ